MNAATLSREETQVPRRHLSSFSLSDRMAKEKSNSPAPHSRVRQLLNPPRIPSFRNSFPQLPPKSRQREGSIQHLSDDFTGVMTTNNRENTGDSMRGSSFTHNQDSIDIDILENSDSHFTMSVLRKCNRQVIRPFQFVLKLVAWEPIFSISTRNRQWIRKFLNGSFTALTVFMLLISCVYQLIFISWNKTTNPLNITSGVSEEAIKERKTDESIEKVIAIYLIPSFLQMIAFLLGYWHFRVLKIENVNVLMEKVFLNFVGSDRGKANQRWINIILRLYLGFCILWTLVSVASNFLFDHGFVYGHSGAESPCMINGYICLLWVAEISGNFVVYLVIMVILFNFSVQCEAIISFMDCLHQKIQERYLELRDVLKDISFVKETIKALNGIPGIMMSIVVFTQGNMSITGVISLFDKASTIKTRQIYKYLFVLRALPLTIFPIILVCRVNRYCNRIQHTGVDVRTYGYRKASQLELDSYVLSSLNNVFRAKLFMIPFRGYHLAAFFIIFVVVVVLLLNMDALNLKLI